MFWDVDLTPASDTKTAKIISHGLNCIHNVELDGITVIHKDVLCVSARLQRQALFLNTAGRRSCQ